LLKATAILARGARGDAVRTLQQQLITVGMTLRGGIDGVFGKSTKAAVKAFQRSKGLRRTGAVDAGTTAVLANAAAAVTPVTTPAPLAPTPAPAPAAPASSISVECAALTNQARAAAGVAPVTVSLTLNAAADGWSQYQASITTMTHGENPGARMTAAGFAWSAWGENVAYGQSSCTDVIAAWLNSPGHRTNMLNPAYTHIGIAVATASNGYMYWTMDLAAPR